MRELIRATDDPLPASLTAILRAMHLRDDIENTFLSVELSVIANRNGRIDSAKPIRGPERFYAQAQEIEMHRAFKPIHDKRRRYRPSALHRLRADRSPEEMVRPLHTVSATH